MSAVALPVLSILLLVLATAVPWGLPPDATFILPLVVVMMVFCWRTIPDAVLNPAVAMLLGLLTDVMSGGPLGFFGLLALDRGDRRRVGAGARRGTPHARALAVLDRLCRTSCRVRLAGRLAVLHALDRSAADRLRGVRVDPALSRGAARSRLDQAWQPVPRLDLPGADVITDDEGPTRDERRLRHRFSRRMVLFGGAQIGLFGLLGWRLHQLQILESSDYRLLSDENRLTFHLVAPSRGAIYDRFGMPIAEDRENLRVLVIPVFCKDLSRTLDMIGTIVPVSAGERDRVMRATRRQSGYYPVLVTEGLTWRQFGLLNVLAPQLPGVRTDQGAYAALSACARARPRRRLCRHGRQGRDPRRPGHAASRLPHRQDRHREGFRCAAQRQARQHHLRGRRAWAHHARAWVCAEHAGERPRPHRGPRTAGDRARPAFGAPRGFDRGARRRDRRDSCDGVDADLRSERRRLQARCEPLARSRGDKGPSLREPRDPRPLSARLHVQSLHGARWPRRPA